MRGGVWKFKEILTYDFLYQNWIVLNKSAGTIGEEIGGTESPVYAALKRHGITAAMKAPQDLSAFYASGAKTRFQTGQVAPMKGKKGHSPAWKGKTKENDPVVARIANSNRGVPRPCTRGHLHHHWKPGPKIDARSIRNSFEYREWRKAVYIRDDYTCKKCNVRGGKLHAHHILRFSTHPHLRLDVSNGMTLCIPCHYTIHGKKIPKKRS